MQRTFARLDYRFDKAFGFLLKCPNMAIPDDDNNANKVWRCFRRRGPRQ